VITRQTSPEEAYRKLDEMATKQTETLRKLTKQVKYIVIELFISDIYIFKLTILLLFIYFMIHKVIWDFQQSLL